MLTRLGYSLLLSLLFSSLFAQSDTIRLTLGTRTVSAINETTCLPLTADNFAGVLSAQFSLTWDTERLAFSSVELGDNPLGLGANQYNVAADTAVGVSWTSNDGQPVTIPDNSVLMEVCLTNLAESGFSAVTFDGWLEPEFAVGPPIVLGEYVVTPGGIDIEAVEVGIMYPGDTNADSVVNYLDILPIGLGFGTVGPTRPDGTTAFSEQTAPVWAQNLPNSGVNYRHIDADGDGQIGNADAAVITANYGAAIDPLWEAPSSAAGRMQVPQLYVKADTLQGGQTGVLEIYLEDGQNNIEVYGMGFVLSYDPDRVVAGSFDVDFTGSFFAGNGASLLTLDRELSSAGELHVALTRRNKNNFAGSGLVARVSFQPLAVAPGSIDELPMSVSGIQLLSADEFATAVVGQTTNIGIEGTTGTREPTWAQELRIYPNPITATTPLHLRAPQGKITAMQVYSTTGQLVLQQAYAEQIDLGRLAAGTYLLRLTGPDGVVTREIVKR